MYEAADPALGAVSSKLCKSLFMLSQLPAPGRYARSMQCTSPVPAHGSFHSV